MKNSTNTFFDKIYQALSKNSVSPVNYEAKSSLDIYKVSSRLNRSFLWEGSIVSSIYIIPLILFLGLVCACSWLLCACVYYNMKGKKFKLPCQNRKSKAKDETTKVLTSAMLQVRRQERLAELQAECSHLEQQLAEEKGSRLTSRASDSDLEYLGASESPPLKRNSISLQDLPTSVLKIRREKELRTLKAEIEHLKTLSKQSLTEVGLEKDIQPVLNGLPKDFQIPVSRLSSPSDSETNGNSDISNGAANMPLSQHITHLKTQRRLNQIKSELEDLAIQFLSGSDKEGKCSSLQDLPRTALNVQREQQLLTITNEIEKMKKYKQGHGTVIKTVLHGKERKAITKQNLAELNKEGSSFRKGSSGSSAENLISVQDNVVPTFGHNTSLKRQREHELTRVRAELRDLAAKLNYPTEDREKVNQRNTVNRSSLKKQADTKEDDSGAQPV